MSAEQLWDTTLNPQSRYLKRITIEDAKRATELTNILMGSSVPPRKEFIHKHANEANIDA